MPERDGSGDPNAGFVALAIVKAPPPSEMCLEDPLWCAGCGREIRDENCWGLPEGCYHADCYTPEGAP